MVDRHAAYAAYESEVVQMATVVDFRLWVDLESVVITARGEKGEVK